MHIWSFERQHQAVAVTAVTLLNDEQTEVVLTQKRLLPPTEAKLFASFQFVAQGQAFSHAGT